MDTAEQRVTGSLMLLLGLIIILAIALYVPRLRSMEKESYLWESLPLHGGGYIKVVAVDPKSPNVVYAGCDIGGMYKSTDYGDSWVIINKGLVKDSDLAIATIAVDPQDTSLVYIGTGTCWGRPTGPWGGIFKSTDAGNSWKLLTRDVKFNAIGTYTTVGKLIAIDYSDTRVLYAGSHYDGIYKSTDAGATWVYKGLKDKYVTSVVLSPKNRTTVYVSARRVAEASGGVFKSMDGGESWIQLNNSLSVHDLAVDPVNPEILYAACEREGIYKSFDGGVSWLPKNRGLNLVAPSGHSLSYLWERGFVQVAVNPASPSVVYAVSAGPGEIYKSSDGGENWRKIPSSISRVYDDGWWGKNWWFAYATDTMALNPKNPEQVYIGDWHKIWRTDDGGETWHVKPWGLETTAVRAVAVDPKAPGTIYAGVQDVGLFKSTDYGKSFKRLGFGNIWSITLDPKNPDIIYVGEGSWGQKENPGAVYKSVDGGLSWLKISVSYGLPNARVFSVVVDPSDPQTLYAGLERNGVYKSLDGGKSWIKKDLGIPSGANARYLIINPKNPSTLYSLIWDNNKGSPAGYGVYKTINGGENWTRKSDGIATFSGGEYNLYSISLDPNNPENLYAGSLSYGVYKTENGGSSWTQVLPNSQAGYIAVGPDSTVYVACHTFWWDNLENRAGFYKSYDGGSSWKRLDNDELPNLRIGVITVDPQDPSCIFVGTSGNGVFKGIKMGTVTLSGMIGRASAEIIAADMINSRLKLAKEMTAKG